MIYIIIGMAIAIISIIYCIKEKAKIHKINNDVDKINKELEEKNNDLLNKKELYTIQYSDLCKDLNIIKKMLDEKDNSYKKLTLEESAIIKKINQLNEIAKNIYKDAEASAKASYDNYCEDLNKKRIATKESYNNYEELLRNSYFNIQLQLLEESEEIQKELEKIKASRDALIEAQLREKELKEKSAFYCIQISDADKADISKLESIRKTFNKPRVISMLIWQTYYQKNLKAKSAEILGTSNTVTGIYKITNIDTNECYIGQAVN